jgi:hypothetical protein
VPDFHPLTTFLDATSDKGSRASIPAHEGPGAITFTCGGGGRGKDDAPAELQKCRHRHQTDPCRHSTPHASVSLAPFVASQSFIAKSSRLRLQTKPFPKKGKRVDQNLPKTFI